MLSGEMKTYPEGKTFNGSEMTSFFGLDVSNLRVWLVAPQDQSKMATRLNGPKDVAPIRLLVQILSQKP